MIFDCCDLGNPYSDGEMIGLYADPPNRDTSFKLYFEEGPIFKITSPEQNETHIKDSWITVTGTCVTDGTNQIAFTNNCSDFSSLDYTVNCINNQFSADFYYNGISDISFKFPMHINLSIITISYSGTNYCRIFRHFFSSFYFTTFK